MGALTLERGEKCISSFLRAGCSAPSSCPRSLKCTSLDKSRNAFHQADVNFSSPTADSDKCPIFIMQLAPPRDLFPPSGRLVFHGRAECG